MSLRIIKGAPARGQIQEEAAPAGGPPPAKGDDWTTRLAKLVPAEALGLYGSLVSAVGMTKDPHVRIAALWAIALLCLIFSGWLRMKATQGQIKAVAIALVSFVIWLVAIGPPNSPLPALPEDYRFIPTVVAIAWAALISQYQGDAPAPPAGG